MIRKRVIVQGAVQGVFFRDLCRQEANRRLVTGWVTNRTDGTVEAVFEGQQSDVDAMVEWARHGSPRARVSGIAVTEEAPQGESEFRVV